MPTFNENCLATVQQVRSDIAPGVSGWVKAVEGQDIRSLTAAAQETLGIPGAERLAVRNRVNQQIADELPGGGSERARERGATAGQFNAALIAAEGHFQDLVDEDAAEG